MVNRKPKRHRFLEKFIEIRRQRLLSVEDMHLNQWSSVHLRTFFLPSDSSDPALLGGLWSWKILSRMPKFGTPRSWCCCPRHPPDFQSFSCVICVMDSWHGTLNIIGIIEHVFKCPIQMSYRFNRFQEFVSQVSHIDIQCLRRSSVVSKSGWASFKLSEGTCLGRSFLERRPPRFQCDMDWYGVLMPVM